MENSDLVFTYYTFTMPSEDVMVEIETKGVDIPIPPDHPSGNPSDDDMTHSGYTVAIDLLRYTWDGTNTCNITRPYCGASNYAWMQCYQSQIL